MTAPGDQGTCYGFRIHSPIPFSSLRDGPGHPLEILSSLHHAPSQAMHLIGEWTQLPGSRPFARLYQQNSDYWLQTVGNRWTLIEPAVPRIVLPPDDDPARSEEHVWSIPVALCLLHHRDLALHASAVEINGRALLLVASGGAGKSTLAAAFAAAGHRVLSEDVTGVRPDSAPAVIPGPAMLRLRPEVMAHLTLPGSRVIRTLPSRLTLVLDGPRGTCDPVPLRGICLLESSTREFSLRRIPTARAIPLLWPMTFHVSSADWHRYCFERLAELTAVTPTWVFSRPLRFEELPRTVEYLVASCTDA